MQCFGAHGHVRAWQSGDASPQSKRQLAGRPGGLRETNHKGGYLMKTTMKPKRRSAALLSILCAGLVATFLGGCADAPYVAYQTGYYPTGYYTGYTYDYNAYPYSYYGPAYDSTIVRSGVRYNDAYGPRYYTRTVYGDW